MLKKEKNLIFILVFTLTFQFRFLSLDLSPSWQWVNPYPTGEDINKVIFADGKYYAVGNCGTILSSYDGKIWEKHLTNTSADINSIAFNGQVFLAVGNGATVLRSFDGFVWNKVSFFESDNFIDISVIDGKFIAITDTFPTGGNIYFSSDGNLWGIAIKSTSDEIFYFRSLCKIGSNLYALGGCSFYDSQNGNWKQSAVIASSVDGENFEIKEYDLSPMFYSLSKNENLFVCSGYNNETLKGILLSSSNLENFEIIAQSPGETIVKEIIYNGSNFYAITSKSPFSFSSSTENYILKSDSGLNWWAVAEIENDEFRSICKGKDGFLAAGSYGTILKSEDGENFFRPTFSLKLYGWLYSSTYAKNKYVVVGTDISESGWKPIIYSSGDGIEWKKANLPENLYGSLEKIFFDEQWGKFFAVGSSMMISSEDSLIWATVNCNNISNYNDIFCNGTMCVAVGSMGDYPAFQASNDGVNWKIKKLDKSGKVHSISYGNGIWVAAGQKLNGKLKIWRSTDGIKWKKVALPSKKLTGQTARIAFGGGIFLVSTEGSYLLKSENGSDWILIEKPDKLNALPLIPSLSYKEGLFYGLAQGNGAHFISSENGAEWAVSNEFSKLFILDVKFDGEKFISVGDAGAILFGN